MAATKEKTVLVVHTAEITIFIMGNVLPAAKKKKGNRKWKIDIYDTVK